MSKSMIIASCKMEALFEWQKWCKEIPSLKFNPEWEIKVIPPFAGAVVRFIVSKDNKTVSVYLDCYENLGFFGGPHWEIYPDKFGDNSRFAMNDTEALITAIEESFQPKDQKNE